MEEDKELDILAAKADQTQGNLIALGFITLALNAAVIIALMAYFIRQKHQLQKQKEQIVQSALEQQ